MNGKKTYIGYDLGDGETIVDIATLDNSAVKQSVQTLFKAMTMPDSNTPGLAMPTVYGYDSNRKIAFASSILMDFENIDDVVINFKRRPSDLFGNISESRQREIVQLLKKGWPNSNVCAELYSHKMNEFKQAVVTFTNGIFEHPGFQKVIRDEAVDSDEIVFCVGHPTRWNSFDVAVYEAILKSSVLGKGAYAGKTSSVTMAAESRAAFLYVKEKAQSSVLPKGTSALLIDVGSSTIDITAMTADSRNHQYNSGNNYLGARFFDHAIREKYLETLSRDEEEWAVYQDTVALNPQSANNAITLSCRKAKEEVFSVNAQKSRIIFADLMPKRIALAEIEDIAEKVPVAQVLKRNFNIPQEVVTAMGSKSWTLLFREFLNDTKAEMRAQDIKVGRIILTGSASKMNFVPKIIKEVFSELPDNSVLNDVDPSRTISMGLALVGPSNDKSKGFQQDLEQIIEKDVPAIIDKDLEKLADPLSNVINNVVESIAMRRINEWKSMKIDTLQHMTDKIKADCSESNLNRILGNNAEYKRAIENWTVNVIGKDIAVKLQSLCEKYGVKNLSLDSLNVMKVSSVNVEGISFDPTKDIANAVAAIIAIVAGIIAAVVLPFVLGVVIGLISWISVGLASALLSILLAIPGAGWAILLGIAGIIVIKQAASGLDGAKRVLSEKIQKVNLPQWVRNRMTDEKIKNEIAKADMKGQIKASILKPESKKKIVKSVSDALSDQIKKRADDIKYVIESK